MMSPNRVPHRATNLLWGGLFPRCAGDGWRLESETSDLSRVKQLRWFCDLAARAESPMLERNKSIRVRTFWGEQGGV